ncbi:hypothetical protein F4677DRAFT_5211 [Hypoxylon crocopeplum]|nr:hypothetical protein F4677DRAFT_5211 [Hypoxylon crocopeplum]
MRSPKANPGSPSARSSIPQAVSPTPCTPAKQLMASPAKHLIDRPMNPTPGNPKNWEAVASPGTPGQSSDYLLSSPESAGNPKGTGNPGRPINRAPTTPGSTQVGASANSSDGEVFIIGSPPSDDSYVSEPHGADSRAASWSQAINRPSTPDAESSSVMPYDSPTSSNRTVITRRDVGGSTQSWVTMPNYVESLPESSTAGRPSSVEYRSLREREQRRYGAIASREWHEEELRRARRARRYAAWIEATNAQFRLIYAILAFCVIFITTTIFMVLHRT